MQSYREALRSKGQYVLDYAGYQSLVMLMLIKYKNLDLKYELSNNIHDQTMGNCDVLATFDGFKNNHNLCMGIEDFFGNFWKKVEGIIQYNDNLYINTNIENIENWPDNMANYTKVNSKYQKEPSFVRDIALDDVFSWIMFPISGDGAVHTPYYTYYADGIRMIHYGGAGGDSGLLSLSCNAALSDAWAHNGVLSFEIVKL